MFFKLHTFHQNVVALKYNLRRLPAQATGLEYELYWAGQQTGNKCRLSGL